ncbi:hypothetical protein REPUB_Repub20aG0124400 [Reevesia pubescens]
MCSTRIDGSAMRDREEVHVIRSTAMENQLGMKYEVGDMVWGKVQSHPWWPGQIFDEALALPIVSETKREGHLLVAFFGDDTFGWFDPIKLIPFNPNYMEKSKQTNDRAFIDAVQDAENEICRRAALGLSCCCRNPLNFEATVVKGFFLVDVEGYGPGAIYTGKQISRARNRFQPTEMLCFLKWLALMPCCNLKKGVDRFKNMAIVLAYRKAVFGEFDETYLSAFGLGPPQGIGNSSRSLDLHGKLSFEALVSRPHESHEALARSKCTSRPKEDKTKNYRNEGGISRVHSDQVPQNFSILSVYEKENAVVMGDNILQTSAPSAALVSESLSQQKLIQNFGGTSMNLSRDVAAIGATTINKKTVLGKIRSINMMVDREQPPQGLAKVGNLEMVAVDNTLPLSGVVSHTKVLLTSCGKMNKQPRVSNWLGENLTSKEAVKVDKRKRKTDFKLESGLEHSYKRLKSVKVETSAGIAYGKSFQTGLHCRDKKILGQQGRENDASYRNYEVSQLLNNLLAFALNPFHAVEVEHTAFAAEQFFLRFRSSMFLKNFVVSPLTEFELIENNHPESLPYAILKSPFDVDSQEVPSASKPSKKRLRPDDYEMFGGNNSNPCRKEGVSVKRLINLSKLKSLSAEGKVKYPKPLKSLTMDEKERAVPDSTKQGKNLIKKQKTSIKAAERTMLVMQFPPRSALPSVSELKARFARFGPLDSVPRLFWKSSTCQIVFRYKSDAHVAYRFASRNKSMFGNANVNSYLQALEVPALEPPNPRKHHVQEGLDKFPWSAPIETGDFTEKQKSIAAREQELSHSMFQPKSCLKKSQRDEFGVGPLHVKHVKFRLNEDQSSSGEQLIVNSSVKNSNANQPGGSSLCCNAAAEIPGNWQVFVAQSPPALHPLLNQITDTLNNHGLDHFVAECNARYEAEARNNCIYSTPTTFNVDISSRMLNLMTRCSEIVSDLKCWLGYVPIHL